MAHGCQALKPPPCSPSLSLAEPEAVRTDSRTQASRRFPAEQTPAHPGRAPQAPAQAWRPAALAVFYLIYEHKSWVGPYTATKGG